jgi:hypothetical protein
VSVARTEKRSNNRETRQRGGSFWRDPEVLTGEAHDGYRRQSRRSAEITDSAEFDPRGARRQLLWASFLGGHDIDVKPTGIARIFDEFPRLLMRSSGISAS